MFWHSRSASEYWMYMIINPRLSWLLLSMTCWWKRPGVLSWHHLILNTTRQSGCSWCHPHANIHRFSKSVHVNIMRDFVLFCMNNMKIKLIYYFHRQNNRCTVSNCIEVHIYRYLELYISILCLNIQIISFIYTIVINQQPLLNLKRWTQSQFLKTFPIARMVEKIWNHGYP